MRAEPQPLGDRELAGNRSVAASLRHQGQHFALPRSQALDGSVYCTPLLRLRRITEVDGRTEVRFTHEGLVPEVECYDVCWVAWGGYVTGSLHDLITTGKGQPNLIESPAAVEQVRATLTSRG